MADKPILIFPAATVAARAGLPPAFPPRPPRPSQAQQRQRLTARFQALSQQFGTIQTDTAGIDPEQVIVLETVGSLSNFQNVVRRIQGMEWLGDFDVDVASDDPGFLVDGTDPTELKGRLFVVAANRTAYNELLSLWNRWTQAADEKLPRNYGPLAEAFKYLNDVRPWGPKDRVQATSVVLSWQAGLAANIPTIRFEAELWCRADAAARDAAFGRVQAATTGVGGQCIKQAQIPDIDYHGVLLEVPAPAVREAVDALTADTDTRLLRLTDVKYFAPMGQASIVTVPDGEPTPPAERPIPTGDPVAALLDGLPLANHAALQGRLRIDDPDDYGALYQVGEHRHGTAMASLIIHGELDADEPALDSVIYVRPVLHPGSLDHNNRRSESFPPDELPVDLVHRAVRRILEGDGESRAQAPAVRIVNLSLGDASQLFDRQLSPWARLLDWLAWKYRILFVVSAGNHLENLTIPVPPNAVTDLSDADLRAHTLRSMAHQRVRRRLLAPAESVNALSVGALHAQAAPDGPTAHLVDLLRQAALPSPVSPVASGFRRGIKPEILVPGGHRLYEPKIQTSGAAAEFKISDAAGQPGQLVAAPGGTAIPPNHAVRVSGTSNAASLTTRRALQLLERIVQMRTEPGGDVLDDARLAVILKAMLVHGASWGAWPDFIEQVFDDTDNGMERWWRNKRNCARFLGYGPADFDRGTVCNDQRVIMLGCGELNANEGHVYQVPLPPALHAQTVKRRLTITLAWLSPMNPRHRSYRVADLWFDPPGNYLHVRRTDADHDAVRRGTVQHEVLEGDAAVVINDGDTMPVQVNCRPDGATKLTVSVPYALMVSIETARPLAVSVYDQVKVALDRLREPARVRPAVRTGRAR